MSQHNRPRLLYYCLSLVGIGHLTASLQIIQELLNDFDVDLIYGGIHYANLPKQEGFRVLPLPALLLDETDNLYSPEPETTIDEIWRQRLDGIQEFLSAQYQGIVVASRPD